VIAVCLDRYVIDDARYALSIPGYPLGLLFIGPRRDDAVQCDYAVHGIHVDVGRAGLIVHRQFAFHYGGDDGIVDAPPFAIRARQREERSQNNFQMLFIHGDSLKAGSGLKRDSAKGVMRALRAF
jgi:hypothetical protein